MSAGETVEMSSAGATLTKSVFVALRGRANALRQAVPGEGIEFRFTRDLMKRLGSPQRVPSPPASGF
jgi:hypothetical protein